MKMAGAAEAAHNKQLLISFILLDVPLSFILKLLAMLFCFMVSCWCHSFKLFLYMSNQDDQQILTTY